MSEPRRTSAIAGSMFNGLSDGVGGFVFMVAANVAALAWVAMLVVGAMWHWFDIGEPIGFIASLPIGAGLLVAIVFSLWASKRRRSA